MMNVRSPIKKYTRNKFMMPFFTRKFGIGKCFKSLDQISFKVLFATRRQKSVKITCRKKFFFAAPAIYSHFISKMTLFDKGGNMCPLLA